MINYIFFLPRIDSSWWARSQHNTFMTEVLTRLWASWVLWDIWTTVPIPHHKPAHIHIYEFKFFMWLYSTHKNCRWKWMYLLGYLWLFTIFKSIINVSIRTPRISNIIHIRKHWSTFKISELQQKKKQYLIVGFNLPDEDGEVLDSQCGVIVDFLVGPLYCCLWISARRKTTLLNPIWIKPRQINTGIKHRNIPLMLVFQTQCCLSPLYPDVWALNSYIQLNHQIKWNQTIKAQSVWVIILVRWSCSWCIK